VLETSRLLLRRFTEGDLEALAVLMSDIDFMRFSLGPYSRGQTAIFLDRILAGYRDQLPSQFAVILRAENRLIGYCGFFPQVVDNTEEIEIGYRLDSKYWGRGLATEAAQAVRDHAFNDLELDHVISLIHPDNVASRRVAEKNGMIPEKETEFRGFPTVVFGIRRSGQRL
jgi:RimJ/RimL family protein N-acetyltransferase